MKKNETRCGTAVLVGLPNVGKSSILNALVGQKIAATSHKPQTTRRQLRGVLTAEGSQIVFVDTPGILESRYELQSFMREQVLTAMEGVDVVVFVVDASTDEMHPYTAEQLEACKKIRAKIAKNQALLLVLNKVDKFEDKSVLLPRIAFWAEKTACDVIIPVSAYTKEGLDGLLKEIGQRLPKGPFVYSEEAITDASEREIVTELIREKTMLELSKEVPYRVAVTIETFDESRREDERKPLVDISAVLHVESEGQKKIVIGKQGEKLKTIGMRARKDMEHLLGCKVMLRLFVRVEPNWTSDPKAMRKLGYR